jgi:hypothetical protein
MQVRQYAVDSKREELSRTFDSKRNTRGVELSLSHAAGPGIRYNFGNLRITPKLKVSQPNDPYEREADRLADFVVNGSDSLLPSLQKSERGCSECRNAVYRQVDDLREVESASITDALAGGAPLDSQTREFMESRFGFDFGNVRIHAGEKSARSAEALNSVAYTVGNDIVFGSGEYSPETPRGQRLLAHELAHVIQQGSAIEKGVGAMPMQRAPTGQVQRGFFGSIWKGIKSAASWVGERIRGAAMWAVNLVRDLPARIGRLVTTLVEGIAGVVTFVPEMIGAIRTGGIKGLGNFLWEKLRSAGAWMLNLFTRVFDLVGGPELTELAIHLLSKTSPLTPAMIAAASQVLGPNAIRWGDVRVAEGGILSLIFLINKKRAFTTFHTINLPPGDKSRLDIVVHELTHVYQYEKAGGWYIAQAIHAQATVGYGYGGAAGLQSALATGKHFRDFNREQQAQIAQDYYNLVVGGSPTAYYDPFIKELQAGDL